MLLFSAFLYLCIITANILSSTDNKTKPTKKVSCNSCRLNLLLYRTLTMKRRNCWQQEVGILESFLSYFWHCAGYKSPLSYSNSFPALAVGRNSTNHNIFTPLTNLFPKALVVGTTCLFHSSNRRCTKDATKLFLEQDAKDVAKLLDSAAQTIKLQISLYVKMLATCRKHELFIRVSGIPYTSY